MAAPSLDEPTFRRTVILLIEHGAEGALGVVLNRPSSVPARQALPEPLASAFADDEPVYLGGPVAPDSVIVLADFLAPEMAAGIAFDQVGVLDPKADPALLPDGVRAIRVFGGYAGWAGGQLEREIGEETWIDAACTREDVFCDDPDLLWARVLERKGGRYRLVARMPDDPRLN